MYVDAFCCCKYWVKKVQCKSGQGDDLASLQAACAEKATEVKRSAYV